MSTKLPVPNPTASYWRSEPHRLDSFRSTPSLPQTTDIAIIGAGIAGVSVLHHLLSSQSTTTTDQPPPSILLLEARQTCSGATGRNGGHVKAKTATLLALATTRNPAAAEAVRSFVSANIDALALAAPAGCEFELRRSFDVFTSAADARDIAAGFAAARARGEAWTRDRSWIGERDAERVTSVKGAAGAFSVPACSFWPYKFVLGLLERAMEQQEEKEKAEGGQSVNLQTETPVLALEQEVADDGTVWAVLHTARGSVRARKVVLATNAYTEALLPEYSEVIVPYKGSAAHLALAPERKDGPVFPHLNCTYNLDYGSVLGSDTVDYLNPRPDGGIVVGGGKWLYEQQRELWWGTVDDATLVEPLMKAGHFDNYMQRTFHGWENSGARVEKTWTGSKLLCVPSDMKR